MKSDPRYQDASGILGIITLVMAIGLSVILGMWVEHGRMQGRIDKVLGERERELRQLQAVAGAMDRVENERLEKGLTNGKE